MILVTGVSGVGKTHTIESFLRTGRGHSRLRASELLSGLGLPTAGLSGEEARGNQEAIGAALAAMPGLAGVGVILDGHAAVETEEGLVPVGDVIGDALPIDGVVTITEDTPALAARRAAKGKPGDYALVADLQAREITLSSDWAARMGVAHELVRSGDVDGFKRALDAIKCEGAKGGR